LRNDPADHAPVRLKPDVLQIRTLLLAEHGLTPEDFEEVVCHPEDRDRSWTTNRLAAFGHTLDGHHIIAIYEMIDEMTIEPVTAYEVPEP
jgi:uncharacterized DUF497 family protein